MVRWVFSPHHQHPFSFCLSFSKSSSFRQILSFGGFRSFGSADCCCFLVQGDDDRWRCHHLCHWLLQVSFQVDVPSHSSVINPPSSSFFTWPSQGSWWVGECDSCSGCGTAPGCFQFWWQVLHGGYFLFLPVVFRFIGCHLFAADELLLLWVFDGVFVVLFEQRLEGFRLGQV